MDECRKQFEEFMSKPPYEQDLRRYGPKSAWPDNYRQYPVELAWCAWQELWNQRAESGTFDKPFVFQTRPTVPEGWKLVPIEPTVEIVQAAQDYFVSHDEWGFSGMYRAMLAAAPEVKQ